MVNQDSTPQETPATPIVGSDPLPTGPLGPTQLDSTIRQWFSTLSARLAALEALVLPQQALSADDGAGLQGGLNPDAGHSDLIGGAWSGQDGPQGPGLLTTVPLPSTLRPTDAPLVPTDAPTQPETPPSAHNAPDFGSSGLSESSWGHETPEGGTAVDSFPPGGPAPITHGDPSASSDQFQGAASPVEHQLTPDSAQIGHEGAPQGQDTSSAVGPSPVPADAPAPGPDTALPTPLTPGDTLMGTEQDPHANPPA